GPGIYFHDEIHVSDADGSGDVFLADGTMPAWSPDGMQIVFSGLPNPPVDIREIYVMNADGTGITRVTFNNGQGESSSPDDMARWSPDGQRIVFRSWRDNRNGSDIFTIRPDGTDELRLTTD